jgi:hypothetical protein
MEGLVASDDEEEAVKKRQRSRERSEKPAPLATGSARFGRGLPPGVAEAIAQLQRDGSAEATIFGEHRLEVEHHDRAVVLVFPDGTRAVGTPEQARDLAKLLLGPMTPRRER